jgi:hypothetical protein
MAKTIITIIISILLLIGEIKCFYKMMKCNWNPIGKAEVVYTVSAFTGFGIIIGYINIEDK